MAGRVTKRRERPIHVGLIGESDQKRDRSQRSFGPLPGPPCSQHPPLADILPHGAAESTATHAGQMHRVDSHAPRHGRHRNRFARAGIEQIDGVDPLAWTAVLRAAIRRRNELADRIPQIQLRDLRGAVALADESDDASRNPRCVKPPVGR